MAGVSFVFGATGFVGREVTAQLARANGQVFAHVRPDSKQLADWTAKFTAMGPHVHVDSSAWEVTALAARLAALGVDVVYVLIGTTRGRAKADAVEGNIYEAIDFGLTKIAVDAAVASKRTIRIVYLSSIGADAGARSAYLAARGKAEAAVSGSGLPYLIARPAIITGDRGDDSRMGEHASAVVGDGLLAVVGLFGGKRVRAKYKSTTPAILGAALIRLGGDPEPNRIVDGAALREPTA
jgi:uncharacterized protein YbjT (DUF2867 family)